MFDALIEMFEPLELVGRKASSPMR